MRSLPHLPPSSQGTLEHDTGSARWDEARRDAEITSWLYRGHTSPRVQRWGDRIAACGHSLTYEWRKDAGKWSRRLRSARLSRVRTCPICMWRRSLRLQTDIEARLASIAVSHPTLRPIMLTLTVRNCALEDLRQTVRDITAGWSRLTRRVSMRPVKGWLRSVEITPGKRGPGEAHPHVHCLLLVDETWTEAHFERDFWVKEWAEACRLNYLPIIDVRPITSSGGIVEVLKYCVKAGGYDNDKSWLPEVALALDRLRVFAAGGLIRVTEPDLEEEEERAGQEVEGPPAVPGARPRWSVAIIYTWHTERRRYLRTTHLVDHPCLWKPPKPCG